MRSLVICIPLVFVSVQAHAADPAATYPAKPVRMIVPWAPGGSTDVLARIVAQRYGEVFKQTFVVDNRPGASGNIGSDLVAKAQADGYTLLVGSMSTHVMNPALFSKMPFLGVDDFAPVALLAYVTNVLVVHPSVPVNSVRELIALAKVKPGQVSYASAGVGSTNHLSAALFERLAGVQMLHVPYKGGAPAVVDLVGGQVNVFFTGLTNVQEHARAGKLRILAVTEKKRADSLPNMPTVAETLPGYELAVYYGMFAPKGTPKEIVMKLNSEANRTLQLPEVKTRLTALGVEPASLSPQQYENILRADLAKWTKIIREIGAKAD
jgi:tripartite-type tricarboxylate transporter receptor subunit TctC